MNLRGFVSDRKSVRGVGVSMREIVRVWEQVWEWKSVRVLGCAYELVREPTLVFLWQDELMINFTSSQREQYICQ